MISVWITRPVWSVSEVRLSKIVEKQIDVSIQRFRRVPWSNALAKIQADESIPLSRM
jgi:hypothetical protein